MRVQCATMSMAGPFKQWFPEMTVAGDENNLATDLDLLILTGGADIDPIRYGESPTGASGWIRDRDEAEFNIVRSIMNNNRHTKILGICRGMQLLNIFFGGTLYQDIQSVNKDHSGAHKLLHVIDNDLSKITSVNSLHHQAIRNLGYYRDYETTIMAIEPETGLPELVLWGDRFLGAQFHPEFFSQSKGEDFFSVVKSWVNGDSQIVSPSASYKEEVDWDEEEDLHDEDDDEEDEEEEAENLVDNGETVTRVVNTDPMESGFGRFFQWNVTSHGTSTVSISSDDTISTRSYFIPNNNHDGGDA